MATLVARGSWDANDRQEAARLVYFGESDGRSAGVFAGVGRKTGKTPALIRYIRRDGPKRPQSWPAKATDRVRLSLPRSCAAAAMTGSLGRNSRICRQIEPFG